MSRKVPKIKGIENDSQIRTIGNIYRRLDNSSWKINVEFEPGQIKHSLGISQIPLLARRRILNATKVTQPAGFRMVFDLKNSHWDAVKIKHIPLPGVARRQDREQWCFRIEAGGNQIYLPQLELARALILYEPYLCRLVMSPGGLLEEFDVQQLDDPDSIQINLLPSCSLPRHVRGDNELRRALAMIILDPEMRHAFDSISRYQIEYGKYINNYRVWQFRFDPPSLDQVRLTVRGHFDQTTSSMFVYEIYGLEGLKSNHPHNVHFFDPSFASQTSGQGGVVPVQPKMCADVEIDDDDIPLARGAQEFVLETPQIIRTYRNPAHTTRNGKSRPRSSGRQKESETDEGRNDGVIDISTDESSKIGQLIAGGIDSIHDQSDDTNNYATRFEAFNAMVEVLKINGCEVLLSKLRKLPEIEGFSKQRLEDGNPRCWSIQILSFKKAIFALMEVDTQGSNTRLSTLLVKQPSDDFYWAAVLPEIEKRVVRDSLKWPTKYLNSKFINHNVQRIKHPRNPEKNQDIMDADSVEHWAERILARM